MISNVKTKISNNWTYFETDNSAGEVVNLPHANKLVPYNYFDEKMYQFISRYEKKITVSDANKRVFLMFDGVMTAFTLTVNGKPLSERRGGYIPHVVEITDYVVAGENSIWVTVDSTERSDIPPFGYVVDYLTFGGIYRDVWQYELNDCFIKNCFVEYEMTGDNSAKITPIIQLDSINSCTVAVKLTVCGVTVTQDVNVGCDVGRYTLNSFDVDNITRWSIENPHMECVDVSITDMNGLLDSAQIQVGFRTICFAADKLTLNGEKIKIVGLNRHQSYPYAGYAMPKRSQEQDAKTLKGLGLNTVRTSHYPQSPYFLDECDRLGLLVLEEIPGWQFVSKDNEEWREQVLCDVTGMIERDYNHPSIITWGVRINESQDDHELYTKTNKLARELDSTRKTSGVRCIERSEMIEDIYTMNDFVHDGGDSVLRAQTRCTGKEEHVPYVITEFSGHIFPTKRFDQEERLVEVSLRHARVQSRAAQEDEFLGAIGWCAFDYNTHYDFGSGDRICYHGVMDMFRIPKFSAAAYKSQRTDEYVMEPLTYWARGERNKGEMFPIHVFTNCSEIEIKLGGKSAQRLKRQYFNVDSKTQFLKYPPFVVSLNLGEWGAHLVDVEFIGYENGKAVCSKKFMAAPTFDKLTMEVDDSAIFAGEFDCTRVEVSAVDGVGNHLPYLSESISTEITGDIEIIGPRTIQIIGGKGAFWVRSKVNANKGDATIKATASNGFTASISLKLM